MRIHKKQVSTVVLVKPSSLNKEVANVFSLSVVFEKISQELIELTEVLKRLGVKVLEFSKGNLRVDSLYINDWISFHENGTVVIYPLNEQGRRGERSESVLDLVETHGFVIENVIDYTEAEEEEVYLEGMSSVVLDRSNEVAYVSVSEYTDESLFIEFCEDVEYTPIVFFACDNEGKEIQHTNEILLLGEEFAIIASSCIKDKKERKLVLKQLKEAGKELVFLTEQQFQEFSGASIVLEGKEKSVLLISKKGYDVLTENQLLTLKKYVEIVVVSIDTIEKYGSKSLNSLLGQVLLPE